jgi:ABC-type transporter Mla subunit MlaD
MKKGANLLADLWQSFYRWIKHFTKTFEPLLRVLEMLLLVLATYLGIQNTIESGKFADRVEGHLTRLDKSFADVETSLASIPLRLSEFDSSVNVLTQGVGSLNREFVNQLRYLTTAIDTFQTSLEDYRNSLSRTVEITNKQLSALDKAQQALQEELSRKPKLSILVQHVQLLGDSAVKVL